MNTPQSHGGTEMNAPQSHGGTEMNAPQSHGGTEMNAPRSHGGTEIDGINAITERIIGAAIEVHRVLGPGLLEGVYEAALCIELDAAGLKYHRQIRVPALYKARLLGEYQIDLIVEDSVIVEIKSVERMNPVVEAQLLTYLRVTEKRVGLIINFNSRLVKDGVTRRML